MTVEPGKEASFESRRSSSTPRSPLADPPRRDGALRRRLDELKPALVGDQRHPIRPRPGRRVRRADARAVKSVLLALGRGLAYQVMAAAGALPAAEKLALEAERAPASKVAVAKKLGNRDEADGSRRGGNACSSTSLKEGKSQ